MKSNPLWFLLESFNLYLHIIRILLCLYFDISLIFNRETKFDLGPITDILIINFSMIFCSIQLLT